jgi:hypothetical protein
MARTSDGKGIGKEQRGYQNEENRNIKGGMRFSASEKVGDLQASDRRVVCTRG